MKHIFTRLLSKNLLGGSAYYKCFEKSCHGTSIFNGHSVILCRAHNHDPNPDHVPHLLFLAKLRHLAATTNDSHKNIFSIAQLEHDDGALIAGGFHECIHVMKGYGLS